MSNDKELLNLYTVEANLRYGELPSTLKATWNPNWGLHDEFDELCKRGLGNDADDFIEHIYISINGRLQKKCIFIKDAVSAMWFQDYLQVKLKKIYPSIQVFSKKIERHHLDYRRKKALEEAEKNTVKIKSMMPSRNKPPLSCANLG